MSRLLLDDLACSKPLFEPHGFLVLDIPDGQKGYEQSGKSRHGDTLTFSNMFENFLDRITSPNSRRKHTYCPEVHSDPEDCVEPITPSRKPRLLERRKKGRRVDFGLRQARSLGRLDGLKERLFRRKDTTDDQTTKTTNRPSKKTYGARYHRNTCSPD
ncbi:hypothetical protein ABEB36_008792 [Hypothenemus hampei]|uniref:Uncharacterized protein n=1 Tax=Hypothenemus hampei TaxID=57062 RepID=A0ABD1EN68_HYPHA